MRIIVESEPSESIGNFQDSVDMGACAVNGSHHRLSYLRFDNLLQLLLDKPESIDANDTANPPAARRAIKYAKRYRRWKRICLIVLFITIICLGFSSLDLFF